MNAKDSQEITPIYFAVIKGHAEAVMTLIAVGADVNAKDKNQKTPLHHAASPRVQEALVAAGAAVNAKDNNNKHPSIKLQLLEEWRKPGHLLMLVLT